MDPKPSLHLNFFPGSPTPGTFISDEIKIHVCMMTRVAKKEQGRVETLRMYYNIQATCITASLHQQATNQETQLIIGFILYDEVVHLVSVHGCNGEVSILIRS